MLMLFIVIPLILFQMGGPAVCRPMPVDLHGACQFWKNGCFPAILTALGIFELPIIAY